MERSRWYVKRRHQAQAKSQQSADGFRRAAKRAADDLEDARRRDAEAEVRLRAAVKARRAASAALKGGMRNYGGAREASAPTRNGRCFGATTRRRRLCGRGGGEGAG